MTVGQRALQADTTVSLVAAAARRYGPQLALADATRRWTYAELEQRVLAAGRAFVAAGIQPHDRVAIWCPNQLEWVVACFGLHHAGAVLVPVSTRFKAAEAATVLRQSATRAVVAAGSFLGVDLLATLEEAGDSGGTWRDSLPDLELRIAFNGSSAPGSVSWDAFLNGGSEVTDGELASRMRQVDADDLSDIMFTSGTTGAPKGAMITHGMMVKLFSHFGEVVQMSINDRMLIIPPFSHTFGYRSGFVMCSLFGAGVVPQAVFNLDQMIQAIAAFDITILPGPPTIYQAMLDADLPAGTLSKLRLAITGGTVVPAELVRRMYEDLSFEIVTTAFGLTESCGTATLCLPSDPVKAIAETCGRPIPEVEVTIRPSDGGIASDRNVGEVLVRGYNVMKGYWRDADATAETVDADGWLHTGDVGYFNGEGYLRLVDRIKDLFIVGGFNAYPAEIERQLLTHPSVANVAVVGVPDERLGEVGFAFVVARRGTTIEPAELLAWASKRLANYKVPRYVFTDVELPLTAAGKVHKPTLRRRAHELLAAGEPRS